MDGIIISIAVLVAAGSLFHLLNRIAKAVEAIEHRLATRDSNEPREV